VPGSVGDSTSRPQQIRGPVTAKRAVGQADRNRPNLTRSLTASDGRDAVGRFSACATGSHIAPWRPVQRELHHAAGAAEQINE
jgi:hypothetical protein